MTNETKPALTVLESVELIRSNLTQAQAYAADGSFDALIKGRNLVIDALFDAYRIRRSAPDGFEAECAKRCALISEALRAKRVE